MMKRLRDYDLIGVYTILFLIAAFGFFVSIAIHELIPAIICGSILSIIPIIIER